MGHDAVGWDGADAALLGRDADAGAGDAELGGAEARRVGGRERGEAIAVRLPSPADDDLARGGGGAGGGQGGEVGGRRIMARGRLAGRGWGILTRRGRAGTGLKQQEQGRQHQSPLAEGVWAREGVGARGGARPGRGSRKVFSHEGTKARRREGHCLPPRATR